VVGGGGVGVGSVHGSARQQGTTLLGLAPASRSILSSSSQVLVMSAGGETVVHPLQQSTGGHSVQWTTSLPSLQSSQGGGGQPYDQTAGGASRGGGSPPRRVGPIPDDQYRALTAERMSRAGEAPQDGDGTVPRTPNGRPIYHLAKSLPPPSTAASQGKRGSRGKSRDGGTLGRELSEAIAGANATSAAAGAGANYLRPLTSASELTLLSSQLLSASSSQMLSSQVSYGQSLLSQHRRPRTQHSPQPGQGPYRHDSVASHSVAVQANPAPYRRFYLAKEDAKGTVNSFYHHFDVLDVDAMPVGSTLFTRVPICNQSETRE
jgi:hypothetical protein